MPNANFLCPLKNINSVKKINRENNPFLKKISDAAFEHETPTKGSNIKLQMNEKGCMYDDFASVSSWSDVDSEEEI